MTDDADDRWMTAEGAAALLGVSRRTIYTYVSRGWLRSVPGPSRRRLYARSDVVRLRERARAHEGRAPRAAEALRWGLPVLETAVGAIDRDGPAYRGVPAVDLVDRPVERVAELLWDVPEADWPDPERERASEGPPVLALLALAAGLAASGEDDPRVLVLALAGAFGGRGGIAERMATGLGRPDLAAALSPALVLCADHGLNASTFAARVVASTGAGLAAAVAGGLAALSGPRHGTASLRVGAWLDAPDGAPVQGFQHVLYPDGDPRGAWLVGHAAAIDPHHPRLRAVADARGRWGPPDLDVGLACLVAALGLPDTAAPRLFAVGRSIGWIAHAREQHAAGGLLRPRARYVDDPC